MRRFLFLAMLLPSLSMQAQEKIAGKVSLGVNFSPDYSFRTLKTNSEEPHIDLVIKSRNSREVAKFGFTTGLNLAFACSKLISFETGLQYSAKGYQTKMQHLIYGQPDPGAPTQAKFTYAYQYIGVPLQMKFSLGAGKVQFVTGIGLMTNFLLNAKQTTHLQYANGKKEVNTEPSGTDFKKIDLSPLVSLGIGYTVSNKIHLLAEPTFRYGLIPTKDAPVKEHLWSAGVSIGCYRALN